MAILIADLIKNPRKAVKNLTKKQATSLLARLDKAYFVNSEGLVPDSVYDIIRADLVEQYPELADKIGAVDDSDVPIPVPMASLNQYKLGSSKLSTVLTSKALYVKSDKLDGLSIELVYEKGLLTAMYTRGDAVSGKDVSRHISHVNAPKRIQIKTPFAVRVEALIKPKTFHAKMHEDVGGKFTTARNAAAGLIRRFESSAADLKHVDLVAFEILEGDLAGKPQLKQLSALADMGFKVVNYDVVRMPMSEQELEQLLIDTMAKSEYELDGIVLSKNVSYTVTDSNPSHAFKFKMNSDEDSVLVPCKDVVYQKTMHSYLNPVVTFDPTMIGGVMVSKANGHNGFYIEHGYLFDKKTVGSKIKPIGPGAILKVVRSGKVIPYILEVVKGARKPKLPDVPYSKQGVEFVLEGDDDSTVATRKMVHFVSRLNIEGMASGNIAKIFEAEGDWNRLEAMQPDEDSLSAILGKAAAKAYVKQVAQLHTTGVDAVRWYTANSPWYLEGASDSTYASIVEAVPEVGDYKKSVELAARISAIPRMKNKAQTLAKAIIGMNADARKYGVKLSKPKAIKVVSSALKGVVVGFTGFRDPELTAAILAAGGLAYDGVKANTTVLLAKDPDSGSSKIEKAIQKGIAVMTPATFKRKYTL